MMSKKIMPQKGESISLLCLDCNKTFTGPNPEGLDFVGRLFKKPVCPICGSKRVEPNPFALYKS